MSSAKLRIPREVPRGFLAWRSAPLTPPAGPERPSAVRHGQDAPPVGCFAACPPSGSMIADAGVFARAAVLTAPSVLIAPSAPGTVIPTCSPSGMAPAAAVTASRPATASPSPGATGAAEFAQDKDN